jgi:glycosyltransferase involved in cell wall biosynthesis
MPIEMPSTPLITFYVIAYNQERYIAQAISGAFAQTWSPLEIILSDDNSSDRTYSIMCEMSAAYKGVHKIILNRNEKNLGVGAHINRIVAMSNGVFIVASAGDDVSVPERAERLFRNYCKRGAGARLIYSNLIEIGPEGSEIMRRDFSSETPDGARHKDGWDVLDRVRGNVPPTHGATFGYPKILFTDFGPLNEGVVFEDNVLNWRAELLGEMALCQDHLVLHRNHAEQITNVYSNEAMRSGILVRKRLAWSDVQSLLQNLEDTVQCRNNGAISEATYRLSIGYLRHRLQGTQVEYQAKFGPYWLRLPAAIRYLRLHRERRIKSVAKCVAYAVLPHPLFGSVLSCIGAVRSWRKGDARLPGV